MRSVGRWGVPAGEGLEGPLGTLELLLRSPNSLLPPFRKQYSSLLYWVSPWGHL